MRAISLTAIASNYSVDEIEKALIFNFVNENGIDYSLSDYLSNYLSGLEPNCKLLEEIRFWVTTRLRRL